MPGGINYLAFEPCFDVSADNNTSVEIDAGSVFEIVGFFFPAMTGTAITVYASPTSGGTFTQVKDSDNAAVSIVVSGTATYVGLTETEQAALRGCRFIKLESNGTEAADRDITVAVQRRW